MTSEAQSPLNAPFLAGLLLCASAALGNVSSHTTFNGETIAYTYDALNRLATKTLPATGVGTLAHTVSYAYTPTGQVATVEDERGVTRHSYDARDRLAQVAHPEGWTVSYGYDAAGNRTSLSTKFGTEAAKTTTFEPRRPRRAA